jgi:hypothetical protein
MIIAPASIVGSVCPPRQLIVSFIADWLDYRIEMVSSQGSSSALPCSVPPIVLLSLERHLQNYAFAYTHPMPLMENPPTSLGLGCEYLSRVRLRTICLQRPLWLAISVSFPRLTNW